MFSVNSILQAVDESTGELRVVQSKHSWPMGEVVVRTQHFLFELQIVGYDLYHLFPVKISLGLRNVTWMSIF
jgi:hypothetical protein